MVADPVNAFTGNVFREEVDYKGLGQYPLNFTRYYNSNPWSTQKGWRHTYSMTIDWSLDFNNLLNSTALVRKPDGATVEYRLASYPAPVSGRYYGPFNWTSAQDPYGRLTARGDFSGTAGAPNGSDQISFLYTDERNVNYELATTGAVTANANSSGERASNALSRVYFPSGFQQQIATTVTGLNQYKLVVLDSFGRKIEILQTGQVVNQVSTPDSIDYGRRIGYSSYASDTEWMVLGRYDYVYPDYTQGKIYSKTYAYGESAYAPAALPSVLTSVTDENQHRISNYYYSDSGRAFRTEAEGGLDASTFTFNADGSTVVASADGAVTYLVDNKNGVLRNAGLSQPAGSGCQAAASAVVYETSGVVVGMDDFNGHRMCVATDPVRHLETSRVDGLAGGASGAVCSSVLAVNAATPAGSRKISTQWHPDWKMKTREAMPGKITTWVYNGQTDPLTSQLASCVVNMYGLADPPRSFASNGQIQTVAKPFVCRIVEQATTDTDGHLGFSAALDPTVAARTRSSTYNDAGQVLTETDPNLNTSTYTYYATKAEGDWTASYAPGFYQVGDLKSYTNAKSQTTIYDSYDNSGRLRRVIDPNQVATEYFYSGRGQLTGFSTAGQRTLLDYDPAGRLVKTTLPDGSWVTYEYDAADRQTAVQDQLGNRIEYQLDNLGKRKVESIKDPQGNLRRTVSRTFDALGRVQSTIGKR